ncbi:type III secretion system stator protein SctL [Noviherbaspirillum sp.]|uniref:type III secretion system stator protein SctL n=1 Tax=Noviherbaspirillum sp. TaxID=1926288 RepID=UPI002B463ADF|nr:type III secretion system stator protein SctL [Noviherbaspirillum sp.]HJV80596.1 type III secretion system stator protein SctL [Noviherbaspirillum sp.]
MGEQILGGQQVRLARQGKLVRREEIELWKTGQQCLELAQADARTIIATARENAVREEARGYAEGIRQAQEKQARITLDMIARRDAYIAKVELELVAVVMNAMRKIFSEFDDAERARIIVSKALHTLRNQTQGTIRVHPEQYEAVRRSADTLASACPNLRSLVVESDPRIAAGSCVLLSDIGMIETDIDTQINAIEASLTRAAAAKAGIGIEQGGVPDS